MIVPIWPKLKIQKRKKQKGTNFFMASWCIPTKSQKVKPLNVYIFI